MDELGYSTPASHVSPSGDDGIFAAPICWTSRARGCSGLTCSQQPGPIFQLVAMVCDNCLITHMLEDCVISGFTTNDSTNLVDIVSILGEESSDYEPIHFTNYDENAGFHIVRESTALGL